MEVPTEIKNGQRALIKRSLEEDPDCIKTGLELLKEWGNPEVSCNTANVRIAKVKAHLKQYDGCFKDPELLNIQGIGINNLCHNNTKRFCELNPDFVSALGYNVSSCRCGCVLSYEIHSVVKDKRTGKYWDITKDFNKENQKWFIPLNLTRTADAWDWLDSFERKYDNFSSGSSKCKCPINWSSMTPLLNATEFKADFKEFDEDIYDDIDEAEYNRVVGDKNEMMAWMKEMASAGVMVYM